MANDFLPQDYELPVESNYMQFEDGKNRFRVLSSAVIGQVYWKTIDDKRTPIRKKMGERINTAELERNKWGKLDKPKHFWAFVVYNYAVKKIQILEITQSTVMGALMNLINDMEDWGSPKEYDITVTKSGKDLDTKYTVTPSPKKALDPSIEGEYKALTIDLEALYRGEDPFTGEVMNQSVDVDDLPF